MGLLFYPQGGWGVTPPTEKFRCEPRSATRNAGTDYVVTDASFASPPAAVAAALWFCFYAFKARRRRNAAKSAYYCFRIQSWILADYLTIQGQGGNMESREGIKTITLVQVADLDLWNYAIVKMPTEGYHSA